MSLAATHIGAVTRERPHAMKTMCPPSDASVIDIRPVFREAVQSVWVITTTSRHKKRPIGLTALSVHSVSVDPPLVSFNLNRTSASLEHVLDRARVALHLLAEDQPTLTARFAGPRTQRFQDTTSWEFADDGLPRIHGTAARLLADVDAAYPAGDSYVVIARVTGVEAEGKAPLAHHAGRPAVPAPHPITTTRSFT